jgi:hypothetical protein
MTSHSVNVEFDSREKSGFKQRQKAKCSRRRVKLFHVMCERTTKEHGASGAAHCESCFAFPNEEDARGAARPQVIIAEFIEQNTADSLTLVSSAEQPPMSNYQIACMEKKYD